MPLKINLKSLLLYAVYASALIFVCRALPGAPLAVAPFFAMLICGANIIITPVLFVLASAVNLDLTFSLVCLFMGLFLSVVTLLYRRAQRKLGLEAALYLIIALAPYVAFANWTGFGAAAGINPYILKTVAAAAAGIFTFFCFKSVYAVMYRLYRCRLREDEYVCLAVAYTVVGTGIFAMLGEAFYIILSAAGIIFCTRLARSPSAVIFALVLSMPAAISRLDFGPATAYVLVSATALIFVNAGRFAPGIWVAAAAAGYTYYRGLYACPVPLIVAYALLLFFACFLPSAIPPSTLKNIRAGLLVENVLDGAAISRSRRRTGERMYRISQLFREIEQAFLALDETVDESAAKERMLIQLKDRRCRDCDRAERCKRSGVYAGVKKLIDSGCVKGKVSIIDLPSEVTANCVRPTEMMDELNIILADYRKSLTETENARAGRKLLADQSHGVAEVMKGVAVELSRTLPKTDEAEKTLKETLAAHGFSCPEAYIDGETGEISLTVCGNYRTGPVAEALKASMGRRYILREKISYDGQKTCLTFTAPPRLDAAFGVAYAIKNGEKTSGDTHSVIRINEHSFLMALSDGMGSGEYARKVSEAAISLIEAFYRAEMPRDTILETVNKMLSFNRDERFACIDIAAVDLGSGRADFVKIGSPAGVIMREGQIKLLESQSLPLGILENLRPTVCSETLADGDIIVFMSDGVSSAFHSTTEEVEFFQGLRPLNPQNLADKILAGALERTGHVAADDMTVVCTRLFNND